MVCPRSRYILGRYRAVILGMWLVDRLLIDLIHVKNLFQVWTFGNFLNCMLYDLIDIKSSYLGYR